MEILETLSFIGNISNNGNITWGVGGSLLLRFHQLIDKPNDIDILVDLDHTTQMNQILSLIGTEKEVIRTEPFRTKYFNKFHINYIDLDIMGGFAIEHQEGNYQLSFTQQSIVEHKQVNGVDIPLCTLEDWYIFYWLIPGKKEKAVLIENYFKATGIKHPSVFEEGLKQPLPADLKYKIMHLLKK
ncbi:nucleotidyltransferase domain-containing protein [Gracilibacillus lacisalsi]|uniref:nucleotidyltransferase domain-containing protein n=1 Tax=Gracilibacillus lacisalsi TaxID=393087 RepID=UPI00036BCE22|nr:hypothetical protein [Gracilibacillus lacisalsi]